MLSSPCATTNLGGNLGEERPKEVGQRKSRRKRELAVGRWQEVIKGTDLLLRVLEEKVHGNRRESKKGMLLQGEKKVRT